MAKSREGGFIFSALSGVSGRKSMQLQGGKDMWFLFNYKGAETRIRASGRTRVF